MTAYELTFELVLGALSFGASFFTLKAFFAFRGDVLQGMFGFLSAALLLVGGTAAVEVIDSVLVPGNFSEELPFPIMVGAFVLLLLGLVPLVRWAGNSRQGELHGDGTLTLLEDRA
jgi:hypothetical protein